MELLFEDTLVKENIRIDSYCLNGGANEAYCLNKNHNKFGVYYSERGQKVSLKVFQNEKMLVNIFII